MGIHGDPREREKKPRRQTEGSVDSDAAQTQEQQKLRETREAIIAIIVKLEMMNPDEENR